MNNQIPFFSLERQYIKNKIQIQQSVQTVLDSQKFIGGPFVQDFEKNFSEYVKSNFTISCNSGTDALWLALKALDLPKNSIVLTTPFSFIASASEIVAHEAHPVFIDVDKTTYNIDPVKLEQWLSENVSVQTPQIENKNKLTRSRIKSGMTKEKEHNNSCHPENHNSCHPENHNSCHPENHNSCHLENHNSCHPGLDPGSSPSATHKTTGYPIVGIVTVDIFGQCADYKKIKQIADKYGLWIIEDACQAVGATDAQEQHAGTLSDISCFSFYPTKNLGAFGDAGCCTTNNENLAEKLIQLRNHGRKSHYNYISHGINSRMDAIQAAILNEKLKQLDEWNNARRKIAQIYNEQFENLEFITTPKEVNGKHVYHQYCITLNGIDRDLFAQSLKNAGIGTNIYYPKTLNQIEFLNKNEQLKTMCPVAESLTQNILALPIWPELEEKEVLYICEKVREIAVKNVGPVKTQCQNEL